MGSAHNENRVELYCVAFVACENTAARLAQGYFQINAGCVHGVLF